MAPLFNNEGLTQLRIWVSDRDPNGFGTQEPPIGTRPHRPRNSHFIIFEERYGIQRASGRFIYGQNQALCARDLDSAGMPHYLRPSPGSGVQFTLIVRHEVLESLLRIRPPLEHPAAAERSAKGDNTRQNECGGKSSHKSNSFGERRRGACAPKTCPL